jgi:signal transduction histidine kinase
VAITTFVLFLLCIPLLIAAFFAFVNAWAVYFGNLTVCWDWGSPSLIDQCGPDTDSTLTFAGRGLLWLGVVALLVWGGALLLVRPLRQIRAAVDVMGPQNLGQRIEAHGASGETRDVVDSVNAMMDRVANGYEAQRRFAANASHELRTPLAVQRTLVEVAMEDPDTAPHLDRLARQLLRTNERNEHLIEGLVALADSDRGLIGSAPVRIDEVVGHVVETRVPAAESRQVDLTSVLRPCTVMGDSVLLERLAVNLVENAIRYNRPGGSVHVLAGPDARLVVSNTGDVVPAEAIPRLFEPFRRLQSERTHSAGGAGLGLAIVASIVDAHHGTVTAVPLEGGGLTVTVTFPDVPRRASALPTETPTSGGTSY